MTPDPDPHAHLLATARGLSDSLHEALARLGPVPIDPPTHAHVADRLAVEVVNQQLSTRAAAAIWGRVEAAALLRAMSPRDLFVEDHAETLRGCGLSGAKVRAVLAIRAADEAGLFGALLATLPHPERSAVLRSIKGVGQWTADMIGIFHYHDPDIWPAGDVAAVGSLRRLTGCTDTQAYTLPFAPYRSHLARAMWRVRDLVPAPTLAA
jgi:DNA-3-methyladenine glycosylase II